MPVTINGSAGVTTNSGAVYNGLQTDTAKASTSGTSIDFTGIPSWVKRITVMFNGVSTNGSSALIIQLGDAGGVENTGYVSGTGAIQGSSVSQATSVTSGISIIVPAYFAASVTFTGAVIFSLLGSNSWVAFGNGTRESGGTTVFFTSGSKTLSDTLTQVRITTVNGTDTFDAGTINIIYE